MITAGLPLMKNALKPLTKSVLIPLWLSVATAGKYVTIWKKTYGSGTTALIISNEEVEDIIKIVKSLAESGLLIKEIRETIKNQANE